VGARLGLPRALGIHPRRLIDRFSHTDAPRLLSVRRVVRRLPLHSSNDAMIANATPYGLMRMCGANRPAQFRRARHAVKTHLACRLSPALAQRWNAVDAHQTPLESPHPASKERQHTV
jgi:hypothetical protein